MPLGELDEDSSSPEAAFPRFHPESQSSSPEAAFPRFHPESRSSYNSDMAQNVSKPVSVSETTQSAQGYVGYYLSVSTMHSENSVFPWLIIQWNHYQHQKISPSL